jgi:hypothetical protein
MAAIFVRLRLDFAERDGLAGAEDLAIHGFDLRGVFRAAGFAGALSQQLRGRHAVKFLEAAIDENEAQVAIFDRDRRRHGVDHILQQLPALLQRLFGALAVADVDDHRQQGIDAAFAVAQRHFAAETGPEGPVFQADGFLVVQLGGAACKQVAFERPDARGELGAIFACGAAHRKIAEPPSDRIFGTASELGSEGVIDQDVAKLEILDADRCRDGVDHGLEQQAALVERMFGPLAIADVDRHGQ